MEYVKKSYTPLLNGCVTPYIRDVTPVAPAHRSRRRRPQEIHPEYIQMPLAFGSVGEAAPPAFGGYFKIHHLCKGGATPYIRDVKPKPPAHRSRRRRPQEIHPKYIQIQTVGEAAPPAFGGYFEIHFTASLEKLKKSQICHFSFAISYSKLQKIFDPNLSFLVWLYFCILHFTNQNTRTQIVIS